MTAKYERLTAQATAIATFISAVSAFISVGLLYGALRQVTLLNTQIEADHKKSAEQTDLQLKQTGLQLLTELEKSRPINGSPCRRLAVDLDEDAFKSLLNRTVIAIPPELHEQAHACLSDQKPDDLEKMVPEGANTLSVQQPRGTYEHVKSNETPKQSVRYPRLIAHGRCLASQSSYRLAASTRRMGSPCHAGYMKPFVRPVRNQTSALRHT